MGRSSDPASTVLDALKLLREVLHARDWASNCGYKGESAQIQKAWGLFGRSLAEAKDVIDKPEPGQGLACIWLKAIASQAIRIEEALDKYQRDWQQLLYYHNRVLEVLLGPGWEKGCYILGFSRDEGRPIAKALLPPVSFLTKLRKLATRWRDEYPVDDNSPFFGWRETQNRYVQDAANCLLNAVNALEVSTEVIDDEFCTKIINEIDNPKNIVWPRIENESPNSLFDLADWLEGTQVNTADTTENTNSETTQKLHLEIADLEMVTPKIDRHNGQWVVNRKAAEIESLDAGSLAKYRRQGLVTNDKMFGRDPYGRIWRREGTRNSHPWYLRRSLMAEK